jgi:arylsulfatase
MRWETPRRIQLPGHSCGRVRILAGLVAAVVGGCSPSPRDLSNQLPTNPDLNVLVVSFDALRADSLGVLGSELGATPNLDALAGESLVFENAYTSGQATLSSFAGAFSGRLPIHALHRYRMVARPTLAELFAANGYVTAGFLNNPWTRRFRRGFAHFRGRFPDNSDEAMLQDASRWLERHASQRFFAWIHFINPHMPYDRREMAEAFYTPAYKGTFTESSGLFLDGWLKPRSHTRLHELYVGEVHYADSLFGRLWSHLHDLGLEDRTVLVVTADHGEAFGEHGSYGHSNVY